MNSDKKKSTILIVDDEPDVLKTLRRILEKKGYEVIPHGNPVTALEYLRQASVDLILTDLKMPEMDGIQFLYQAKQMHPAIPVIVVTAFATIDTAVTAVKFGGYDYLRKPFDIEKIYSVVERALSEPKKRP